MSMITMERLKEMSNSVLDRIFQNGYADSKCQKMAAKETDYIGIPLANRNFTQSHTAEKIKKLSDRDETKLTDKVDDTVSNNELQQRFNLYVIKVADIFHPEEVSGSDYVEISNELCTDEVSVEIQENNNGGSVTDTSLEVIVERTEHMQNTTTVSVSVSNKTFKEDAKQKIAQNKEIYYNNAEFLSTPELSITALSNRSVSEQHDGNDSVINSDLTIKTEHEDPEIENLVDTYQINNVEVRTVPQNKQHNETETIESVHVEGKQTAMTKEDNEKKTNINSKEKVVSNNINESEKQSYTAGTDGLDVSCEAQSEDMNDLSSSMPIEVYMDIDHDGDNTVIDNFTSNTHTATDLANSSDLQEKACIDMSDKLCSSFVSEESSDTFLDEPVKFLNSGTDSSDHSKEKPNVTNKETLKDNDKVNINNSKVIRDNKFIDKTAPNIISKTAKVITEQCSSETPSLQKKTLQPKNRLEKKEIRSSYTFSSIKRTSTSNGNVMLNKNANIKGKRKLDSTDDGKVSKVKKNKYLDLGEGCNNDKSDKNKEKLDKISNSKKKISINKDKEVKEKKIEMNEGNYKNKDNYHEEQRVKVKKHASKKPDNGMNKTETRLTGVKLNKNPLSEKDNIKNNDVQLNNSKTDLHTYNSKQIKGGLIVARDISSKSQQASKRRNSGEKHNTYTSKVLKDSSSEVNRGKKIKDQNTKNLETDQSVVVNEMKRPERNKEIFKKGQPDCNEEKRKVSDPSEQCRSLESDKEVADNEHRNEHASNSTKVVRHSACEVTDRKRTDSGQDRDNADNKSNTVSESSLPSSKISKRRNSIDDYEVNNKNCKKIKTTADEKCMKNGHEKQNSARNMSYVPKDMKTQSPKPDVVNSETQERIWKWLAASDEIDCNKTDSEKNTTMSLQVKFDFKIPKKTDKEIISKVGARTTSVNSSTENFVERISSCQELTKEPQKETTIGKQNRPKLSKNDDCKHTVDSSRIEQMDDVTPVELVHEIDSIVAEKKTKDDQLTNSSKRYSVKKNYERSKQLAHKSSETMNKQSKITTTTEKRYNQHRHKSGDSDKSAKSENKRNHYSNDKVKQSDIYRNKIVPVNLHVVSKADTKKVEIAGDRNCSNTENILVHEAKRVNTKQKLIDDSKDCEQVISEKAIQPKEVGIKDYPHIISRKPEGTNVNNKEVPNEKISKDEERATFKCSEHGLDKTDNRTQETENKKENESNISDCINTVRIHQCKTCKKAFFTYFEDLKKHEVTCISTVRETEKDPKCTEVKPTDENKVISSDLNKTSVESRPRKNSFIRERSSSVVESDSLKSDKSNLVGQNLCTTAVTKSNKASVNIQSERNLSRKNHESVRNCKPYVNNKRMIKCEKCDKSWFSNEHDFKIHWQKCGASNKISESAHFKKDSNIMNAPNSKDTFTTANGNKIPDYDVGRGCETFISPFLRHRDLHANHGFSDGSHPDCKHYLCFRGNEMCRLCKNAFFRCKGELLNHTEICRKKMRNDLRRQRKYTSIRPRTKKNNRY